MKKLNKVKCFLYDNAEIIFSIMASLGTVGVAIFSARGTVKAQGAIDVLRINKKIAETNYSKDYDYTIEEYMKRVEVTKKEKFKCGWKYYIPAFASTMFTIGCIFAANRIGYNKKAKLVSSYIYTRTLLEQYRNGVAAAVGEDMEKQLFTEAKERTALYSDYLCTEDKEGDTEFHLMTYEKDEQGKYIAVPYRSFKSNLLFVDEARYHLNRNFTGRGYATYNQFLEFLNEEPDPNGDYIGWDIEHFWEGGLEIPWIDIEVIPSNNPETGELYYEIYFDFEPEVLSDDIIGSTYHSYPPEG